MTDQIRTIVDEIESKIVSYRRDFHRYAESGWTEFRTASLVARRLADLGYQVQAGREVVCAAERMGLPAPEVLEERWQRAVREGGDPAFLQATQGGFTGVVGILRAGTAHPDRTDGTPYSDRTGGTPTKLVSRPPIQGPTIGMRFDMDALEMAESQRPDHHPVREGFASVHPEAMHACGHDGHTAVGLGVAEVLARLRGQVHGTVKLIFQPAEEGVRGARAMVSAGVVDDVNYLIGHHLYSGWKTGEVAGGKGGYLATTKFDATFTGAPAHAAGNPQAGKNALLAAATAVLNLYAIPRHRGGTTRINVGRLEAGTSRNVICANAHLAIETRGETGELNAYMYDYALRVLRAAAQMHDCRLEIVPMGSAQSANSTPELAARVERIALGMGTFSIRSPEAGGGSEDFTYMMERVQQRGGQATNVSIGADLGGWGHHTAEFDIDEGALAKAIALLSLVAMDIAMQGIMNSHPCAAGHHRA